MAPPDARWTTSFTAQFQCLSCSVTCVIRTAVQQKEEEEEDDDTSQSITLLPTYTLHAKGCAVCFCTLSPGIQLFIGAVI